MTEFTMAVKCGCMEAVSAVLREELYVHLDSHDEDFFLILDSVYDVGPLDDQGRSQPFCHAYIEIGHDGVSLYDNRSHLDGGLLPYEDPHLIDLLVERVKRY
jgi:hypothetical protein